MNHSRIKLALTIILFLTAALFTYALAIGADFETMIAVSFTGVTATFLIAFNERVNKLNQ